MANARPRIGATKNDSDTFRSRDRRSGWVKRSQGRGNNCFTNPAHGARAKAQCAIGVWNPRTAGLKIPVPRQGSCNVRGPGSCHAATHWHRGVTGLGVRVT
jgi:hypothetical protein